MRARTLVLIIAVFVLGGFAILAPYRETQAGLFAYRLSGGPFGRYYMVSPNVNPSWYSVITVNGVNSWNNAITWNGSHVVSFSQTSNWSNSAIDYYADEYGANGLRAWTGWFLSNGTSAGVPPSTNWAYAEIRFNNTYMYDDIYGNLPNRSMNTAVHEFGHAIGLSHDPYVWNIMYPTIANYDQYGIYTPQLDDISYADAAY